MALGVWVRMMTQTDNNKMQRKTIFQVKNETTKITRNKGGCESFQIYCKFTLFLLLLLIWSLSHIRSLPFRAGNFEWSTVLFILLMHIHTLGQLFLQTSVCQFSSPKNYGLEGISFELISIVAHYDRERVLNRAIGIIMRKFFLNKLFVNSWNLCCSWFTKMEISLVSSWKFEIFRESSNRETGLFMNH